VRTEIPLGARRSIKSILDVPPRVRHVAGRLHGADSGAAFGKIVRAVAAGAVPHDEIRARKRIDAKAVIVAHLVAVGLTWTALVVEVNASRGSSASVKTGIATDDAGSGENLDAVESIAEHQAVLHQTIGASVDANTDGTV